MATILERAIDTERGDAIAATALAMGEVPELREFVVKVKHGKEVRQTLSVMGTDSCSVTAQHACLCEAGEYLSVRSRCFALSEAEWLAADLARSTNKAEKAHARNDAAAVEAQLVDFRARGLL